jgi:hypothetical protein
MEYVCDAPNDETWFRLVTEAEAVAESEEMRHAVEKHYRRERERAGESFRPLTSVYIEQDIGKEAANPGAPASSLDPATPIPISIMRARSRLSPIISASVWTGPIAIPIAAEQESVNAKQT